MNNIFDITEYETQEKPSSKRSKRSQKHNVILAFRKADVTRCLTELFLLKRNLFINRYKQ